KELKENSKSNNKSLITTNDSYINPKTGEVFLRTTKLVKDDIKMDSAGTLINVASGVTVGNFNDTLNRLFFAHFDSNDRKGSITKITKLLVEELGLQNIALLIGSEVKIINSDSSEKKILVSDDF